VHALCWNDMGTRVKLMSVYPCMVAIAPAQKGRGGAGGAYMHILELSDR
jgi:hypothetical protein